jgi:hypothetical protein
MQIAKDKAANSEMQQPLRGLKWSEECKTIFVSFEGHVAASELAREEFFFL